MADPSEQWQRYGRALIASMSEVLGDTPENAHTHLLETADYWLSLGLATGLDRREDAECLLALLLEHEQEDRTELSEDARSLCEEVLR